MSALERLDQILDGDLAGLRPRIPAGADAAPTLSAVAGISLSQLDDEELSATLEKFCHRGHRLRALALLKVLAVGEPDGARLSRLLKTMLENDLRCTADSEFADPELAEFLGSDREDHAWSALCNDHLELATPEFPDDRFAPNSYVVCRDPRPEPPFAPFGSALIWRIQEFAEGGTRAQRRATRRRVSFQVGVTLLGGASEGRAHPRLDAWVVDLSSLGMGIVLSDTYGQLGPHTKKGSRLRLNLALPQDREIHTCLAEIAWVKAEKNGEEKQIRLGVRYVTPSPEFLLAVRQVLNQSRGDRQLLWTLWDAQTLKG
ncbi:MAG: PilZ domain-containing protein [Candidatus Eisenbacteria bacterium]|nr:PilZ domain-containing protein [Candidatus Eisenbacteria bacterium]